MMVLIGVEEYHVALPRPDNMDRKISPLGQAPMSLCGCPRQRAP
jgi:hypothetical protein